MKFSVADLLDHLPVSGTLEASKLEKILKLTNRGEKEGLSLALQSLAKLGVVELDTEGEVGRGCGEDLFEARLRCSR